MISLTCVSYKVKIVPRLLKFLKLLERALSSMIHHGTIIRTGITCTKISCYMRNSACRWLIVESTKIFGSCVEHFSIFPRKRNCRTLIGLCKKDFMNYPIMFLDRDNKPKLVPASFLLYLTFMSGK